MYGAGYKGSRRACGGCHGHQETVERAQPAHPKTAQRRGRRRRHPQAGGAHRHQATASQPDPRAQMVVGHGGDRHQLRRGRANLLLCRRAAASSIAARLTYLASCEHGQHRSHRRQVWASFVLASRPPTCPKQRFTAVANGHQQSVAVARDLLHRRSMGGLTMLPKLAVPDHGVHSGSQSSWEPGHLAQERGN